MRMPQSLSVTRWLDWRGLTSRTTTGFRFDRRLRNLAEFTFPKSDFDVAHIERSYDASRQEHSRRNSRDTKKAV
jgi:hypothetical protein